MSYKKPINEGDILLIYSNGKPTPFEVTHYHKDDSYETIQGKVSNFIEQINRTRIICSASRDQNPEYFL
jgi:hypothetical protein